MDGRHFGGAELPPVQLERKEGGIRRGGCFRGGASAERSDNKEGGIGGVPWRREGAL